MANTTLKTLKCQKCKEHLFAIFTEVKGNVTWYFILCEKCGRIAFTLRDEPDSMVPRFFTVERT